MALRADTEEIVERLAWTRFQVWMDRSAGLDGADQQIAADNLSDIDENGSICVAQFDNIEQRLLFPGIRHGCVKSNRSRSNVSAPKFMQPYR
jgi:hypothetical protein